jgi:serine/threonine protein kinase
MPLAAGFRLGPYEILSPIGAGGMSEVYRARDTRLNRPVAIKILSRAAGGDSDSRRALLREAKAISRLDHPHICPLYDIGHEGAVDYLVMQLVEGETLASRLRRGRLPLDEAVTLGTDLADALEAAHRRGLVHRDVKPANVMLTSDGAKLLDFGIASPRSPMAADQTATEPLTALPAFYRVDAKGGSPARVTQPDAASGVSHRWPRFVEDGRRFVYVATSAPPTVVIASLEGEGPAETVTSLAVESQAQIAAADC